MDRLLAHRGWPGIVAPVAGILLAVVLGGCGLRRDDSVSAECRQRMDEAYWAAVGTTLPAHNPVASGMRARLRERDYSPACR